MHDDCFASFNKDTKIQIIKWLKILSAVAIHGANHISCE